eukprot:3483407-Rhodomonas_salina.1
MQPEIDAVSLKTKHGCNTDIHGCDTAINGCDWTTNGCSTAINGYNAAVNRCKNAKKGCNLELDGDRHTPHSLQARATAISVPHRTARRRYLSTAPYSPPPLS